MPVGESELRLLETWLEHPKPRHHKENAVQQFTEQLKSEQSRGDKNDILDLSRIEASKMDVDVQSN